MTTQSAVKKHRIIVTAVSLAMAGAPATMCRAQPYHVIYRFGGPPDGATPNGGLAMDHQKRLYGVTQVGGAFGYGTVYRLTQTTGPRQWSEEVLHSFTQAEGSQPFGPLWIDNSGSLFGVTQRDGPNGGGTVYRLDFDGSNWALTTLHAFGGTGDGATPYSGLTQGPGKFLYGVTGNGGAYGQGTVYRIRATTNGGFYSKLHDFGNSSDGANPLTQVFVGQDGSVIGTTVAGGTSGLGIIFLLLPGEAGVWSESILHNFLGRPTDVSQPPLPQSFISGQNGEFYGCGLGGGADGKGGVFALTPPSQVGGTWTEQLVYSFTGQTDVEGNCQLSSTPTGHIIGTSLGGGSHGFGTYFALSAPSGGGSWSEAILHNFLPKGGTVPFGAPLFHGDWSYGGTTWSKLSGGPGLIYQLKNQP